MIAVPVCLYAGLGFILKIKLRNDIAKHPVIILGDSQTGFIKNPDIYNRSIDGSPYYVQYEFAKQFIEEIEGKQVYIAYNYHNLSNLYQNRLANDSLTPGWRAKTFRMLDAYNIFNYRYSTIRPDGLKYVFFDIKKAPRLFLSLYYPETKENTLNTVSNDTLSIKEAVQKHWKHPEYVLKDTIQRVYLDKLIVLLKKHNCNITLLKMPLTNYYLEHIPDTIKEEFALLPNTYKVQLLDLNRDLSISKNYTYFKDYGHLNRYGDSLVANYFNQHRLDL